MKTRRLAYIYIRYRGQTAIRRRPSGDIWQGLWEPFCVEPPAQPAEAMAQGRALCLKNDVRHVLTHRVILADFYLWEPSRRPSLPDGYVWIPEADIDNYAVPRLVEKLLEMVPPPKEDGVALD